MTTKSLLLLVLAGGCGLVASVVITQRLGGGQVLAPVEELRLVVVAQADQSAGVKLLADMLKVVERPTRGLPDGTFTNIAEVTGQTLQIPVFAGEPIIQAKLGSTLAELSYRLPPGMRAGTVKVDDAAGRLAGLIKPGDHVDVLWLYTSPENGQTTIKVLLQNTEVLAVGTRTSAASMREDVVTGKPQGQNYTLLLTNEQFQTLALATSRGKISLALRGRNDDAYDDASELNLRGLLGLPNIPTQPINVPAPRGMPTQHEIEYVEGGEVRTEKIRIKAPKP